MNSRKIFILAIIFVFHATLTLAISDNIYYSINLSKPDYDELASNLEVRIPNTGTPENRPLIAKYNFYIPGREKRNVSLLIIDNETLYDPRKLHIRGDFGMVEPSPGSKKIIWDISKDFPDYWHKERLPQMIVTTRNIIITKGSKEGIAIVKKIPARKLENAIYKIIIAPVVSPVLNAKFVRIPKGSFIMGSPDYEPGRYKDEKQHVATISKPFYMQATEVTQGQWKKVMGNNPSYFKVCGDNCPVENVSWNDVQVFIKKLNSMEKTGKYRLPTEAEWEYAARAKTDSAYFYNEYKPDGWNMEEAYCIELNLSEIGWYKKTSIHRTHPVGEKKPNSWGLYDMSGNVWEWCSDFYGPYPSTSVTDPPGPSSGRDHVLRGGSFNSYERYCRSATRSRGIPGWMLDAYGFRLVKSN